MKEKIITILLFFTAVSVQAQVAELSGTIEAGTGNFTLSFETEDEKFYIVQTSLDLINFTSLGVALAGNGEQQTFILPRTNQKQFYRLFESNDSNVEIDTTKGLPGADYDSGWIQISTAQTLTLSHDLGSLPRLSIIWGSRVDGQEQIFLMDGKTVRGHGEVGCVIENLTTTNYQIQAGGHFADPRGFTSQPIWVRVYFWK